MARAAAASAAHTYVPDAAQGAVIAEFVRVLDQAGEGSPAGRPALVAATGERLELPDAMYEALRQVAHALSAGQGVSVAPLGARLTTGEAADYLGVSRPTLVRILDRGEIPMHKPGRHRCVQLQDLVEYQERTATERRAALAGMVADAVADDLYDATDRPAPATR